jgi:hypothetical protein
MKGFIENHPKLLFLGIIQGLALAGIFFAIAAHYLAQPFSLTWFLCLDCPLYAFVIWVWCKAIIPWSLKIIDTEGKDSTKNDNVLTAFNKCLKTIESAKTLQQLTTAHKMLCNFNKMYIYGKPYGTENCVYREELYSAYYKQHYALNA